MSELGSALGDIRGIRRQLARSAEFRGYGPATLAATGGVAVAAALAQSVWVPDAARHVAAYIAVWVATAVLAGTLTAASMVTRTRRLHSGFSQEMLTTAVEQFLPAVIAGVLLTVVLLRYAMPAAWMLPGLWQVMYSLGVFASCRFLPRPMMAVGGWFLLCGLLCLGLGEAAAFAPWRMGVAFGGGQMMAAGVLWAYAPEAGYDGNDDGDNEEDAGVDDEA